MPLDHPLPTAGALNMLIAGVHIAHMLHDLIVSPEGPTATKASMDLAAAAARPELPVHLPDAVRQGGQFQLSEACPRGRQEPIKLIGRPEFTTAGRHQLLDELLLSLASFKEGTELKVGGGEPPAQSRGMDVSPKPRSAPMRALLGPSQLHPWGREMAKNVQHGLLRRKSL